MGIFISTVIFIVVIIGAYLFGKQTSRNDGDRDHNRIDGELGSQRKVIDTERENIERERIEIEREGKQLELDRKIIDRDKSLLAELQKRYRKKNPE